MKSQSQNARAAIFAKLNAAPRNEPSHELPQWQAWRSEDLDARVSRLVGCMEASHTEIVRVDRASLVTELVARLQANQFKRVLFGKANPLYEAITHAATTLETSRYDQTIEHLKHDMFDNVDASVTMINAAIADTGTLAVMTGENEPRTLSLVPPVHIAILNESDIVSNFTELMQTPFGSRETGLTPLLPIYC